MGETKTDSVEYGDWDKIVKSKEDSLKVIGANERNLEVGREVETLVLNYAIRERSKYPEPNTKIMEDTETPAETPGNTEESTDSTE